MALFPVRAVVKRIELAVHGMPALILHSHDEWRCVRFLSARALRTNWVKLGKPVKKADEHWTRVTK